MKLLSVYANNILLNTDSSQFYSDYRINWFLFSLLSIIPWYMYPHLIGIFGHKADAASNHIRGSRLVSEADLIKLCESKNRSILNFGKVALSIVHERLHALIVGRTGSGKSTILYQHLEAIQHAERRAVVNDFKGELVEKFYRPGLDQILNPLDARGLGWTVFNDIRMTTDLHAIAASLIPPSHGDDKFWSAAAQAVFKGVLSYCMDSGKLTNVDLWEALTSSTEEIATMCKSTPGGMAGFTYIQDASSKQAAGVIAVLMSYTSWLELANDGDFSIHDWLKNGTGTIFLTTRAEIAQTLKPYISLFIDLLGSKALSLPDTTNTGQNIYFILDEFANLQQLPNVTQLLTAGRSKCLIVEIGVQDLAGIEKIYGREASRTIINNACTKMILPIGGPDTAEYFSKLAGEQEFWQASTSYSFGKKASDSGESHSRQEKIRSIILPSDIMQLQLGEGYLVMPGQNPGRISIPLTAVNSRAVVNAAFEMRAGLDLRHIQKEENDRTAALDKIEVEALAENTTTTATSEISSNEKEHPDKLPRVENLNDDFGY
jgi:type IV secretory pathway TraG/TraD family ATPase VirD4